MQGSSNSLLTGYLRRKILSFKKERKREGGRAHKGGGEKKEGKHLPYHSSQGHRHACGAGMGKAPLTQRVQATETACVKLEYITALNDLSASIRLNISVVGRYPLKRQLPTSPRRGSEAGTSHREGSPTGRGNRRALGWGNRTTQKATPHPSTPPP